MYKLEPWSRVQLCRMGDFSTVFISATHTGWKPESLHFPAVCCVCEVTSSHTRRGDGAEFPFLIADMYSGCFCCKFLFHIV